MNLETRAIVDAIKQLGRDYAALVAPRAPLTGRFRHPRTITINPNDADMAAGGAGKQLMTGGVRIVNSATSHGGGVLEVRLGADGVDSDEEWRRLAPGSALQPPLSRRFEAFRVRLATGNAGTNWSPAAGDRVYLVVEQDPSDLQEEAPRTPQISAAGSMSSKLVASNLAGSDVDVVASDEGALAVSGWDGTAYQRLRAFAAALSDAITNPGAGVQQVGSFLLGWNGAAWERIKSGGGFLKVILTDGAGSAVLWNPADAIDTAAYYQVGAAAFGFGFNGATWDRIRSGIGAPGTGVLRVDPATCPSAVVTRDTATNAAADTLAADSDRDRLTIENLDATESLYVNFGADAATGTGWRIAAGDSLTVRTTERVSVIRGGASDVDFQIVEELKA